MNIPENSRYILFGGNFILSNKMQWVADRVVDGLSSKQWFLLRTLHDMPKTPTITALAKETDTSRQNVTKMLEVLSRQGYVILDDHPQDHRSRTVKMTNNGFQMLEHMAKHAQDFFQTLFSGISEDDCAAAARVTVKMIENLNKMQEKI